MAIQFQCPNKSCYQWMVADPDKRPDKCTKCGTNLKPARRKNELKHRARVRNWSGKQEVIYADNPYSYAETKKKEQEYIVFRDVYKRSNPHKKRPGIDWTMKELFDWARTTIDYKESYTNTRTQKETSWKAWLKEPIAKKKLMDISPGEYSIVMHNMKESGLSPTTVNGRFEHVQWALIRAERDMVIDPEVLSVSRRVRFLRVEKKEPVHFTISQYLTIIKTAPTVKLQAVTHPSPFVTWHQLLSKTVPVGI